MWKYKIWMISLIISSIGLLTACSDVKKIGPIENDHKAPGVISNIQVKNLNGGAEISYSLPDDADLFYVEADYEIRPGVKAQAKSSYYNNSLTIHGFADTGTHKITLYAVDRGKNKSLPVYVTIKPLISPVLEVFKTLSYVASFGGIHVDFRNAHLADLVVNVMIKDSTGDWEGYDKYYSSTALGVFAVRGLPAVPTTFGVFIRDRWNNHSDTLIKNLTPIYEVKLDKAKYRDMTAYLPGVPDPYSGSYTLPHMWDDNINSMYHTTQDVSEGAGFPLHFAFDLGVKAKLSRMKLWPRQGHWAYTHGNVKDMEIWGTNNDPSTWNPFSFDGWIKLAEYHCFKPSGKPSGTNTGADIALSEAGQDLEFPISDPPVRYIMFNVIDNWSQPPNAPAGFAHIAEISFWGQPQP